MNSFGEDNNLKNTDLRPLVSVCMLTYNHEKYLSQAMNSILMQKVNFNYEIIVGEDCSIDNTRKILLEFNNMHPGLFNLILQKSNVGMMKNECDVYNSVRGKYIAFLEGDDYWSDENKLQKQVEFLEANRDFAGAAHQTLIKVEDEHMKYEKFYKKYKNDDIKEELLFHKCNKNVLEFRDLIRSHILHQSSLMFRSYIVKKYNLKDLIFGDHALTLLIASEGKIKYFPDVMSVYRRHSRGMSASSNPYKEYYEQLEWISGIYGLLGKKFFWGYHYLVSKTKFIYSLNYPFETKLSRKDMFYNYLKNIFLTLILFPRNIKTRTKYFKKIII